MNTLNTPSTSLSAVPSETPSPAPAPTAETETAIEEQTDKAYHRPVLRDEGSISHLTHGIIDAPLY